MKRRIFGLLVVLTLLLALPFGAAAMEAVEVDHTEHELQYTPGSNGRHTVYCKTCEQEIGAQDCTFEKGVCTLCNWACDHAGTQQSYEEAVTCNTCGGTLPQLAKTVLNQVELTTVGYEYGASIANFRVTGPAGVKVSDWEVRDEEDAAVTGTFGELAYKVLVRLDFEPGYEPGDSFTVTLDGKQHLGDNAFRLDPLVRSFTVKFSTQYGSQPKDQTVKRGEKAAKPADLTNEDYAFQGWYTTEDYSTAFDFDTAINADTTLYAKWAEKYTVSYKPNGHGRDTMPDDEKVEPGKTATKPADPTEKGWRFDGWYTDAKCTAKYDFDKAVTEDITLYAKWTQLYTLTFETNGGTKIDSVEAPAGSLVYLGDYKPTKSGYYFAGWHTDKSLTQASRVSYVRMDGNKTVYAKFAVADKTNPKTADPALPGLALAVLSFSGMGLAAMGFKKRK